MKKLFDDFLNKRINANNLILKLRKLAKYSCFNDLNILINDIANIIKYGQNEYEEILLVFYQYLDNRKEKSDKIISKFQAINKSNENEK